MKKKSRVFVDIVKIKLASYTQFQERIIPSHLDKGSSTPHNMQTPEEQTTRRSTRRALTEIPTHLGIVSVTDRDGRRSLNNNLQNTFFGGTVNFLEGTAPATVPTTFLSPSPSPDEMIIRQRGRRRIPVIFSPDIDELKRNRSTSSQKDRTPVKQPSSPAVTSSIVLRSTPRKRLLLNDPAESSSGEQSSPKSSLKKSKSEIAETTIDDLSNSLKACTSNQLVQIIEKLLSKRPELEQDLAEIVPKPDLRPLEVHLTFLKRTILKALPTNRLCSKTDAIAYHRAASHLSSFKKTIFDQGRRLCDSKQWTAVADYVLMGWKIVRMIPIFDNQSHNITRKQCFKFLALQCTMAMKNGNFSQDQLNHYLTKLRNFALDSDEMKSCISHLENKVRNLEDSIRT